MNLGVDIPRGGSSCPLFPGQVDFGNVKIFWVVEGGKPEDLFIYISQNPPTFSICPAQVCHGTSIVGVKL